MELNQYLEIFLEESKEHLQLLNEKLLVLENETSNIEVVNEIFRSAHTLKGMAATMGFENMATLTHEMENLLDQVRNRKKMVDSKLMDALFQGVDVLEQMVNSISNGGDGNVDASDVIAEIQVISNGKVVKTSPGSEQQRSNNLNAIHIDFDEYERTVLQQSLASGYTVFNIDVKIDKDTVLKSARAYMVFHELESKGEVLKSIPSVEELEKEEFEDSFKIVLITKNGQEEVKNTILSISEIANVNISTVSGQNVQFESESESEEEKITEKLKNNIETEKKNTQNQKTHSGKMIRVDIDRLDELMNLFSELVIDRGRLEQLANEIKHQGLNDTVEHMSRISSSLQNNILNLRMVPIEQVFNRFPRMIRDLSKELNKKVNLNIYGAETELDRTVIDEIGDPLVHLLRNALDHGLEPTTERIKNNKPEVGEINLKAYHSGNYVFIEVSEDGRGIDREIVINKAVERGLLNQDESSNLTDKQIFDLLFTSGFSTAKKISDISGRGVGLDVVKTKIESLGGYISVESSLGKGTTFIIQLPLTLSIISAMLVKVENEKYAIPLSSIIETAVYKKEKVMSAHKQDVIDFRGRIVPLVYLKNVFEVPETTDNNNNDIAIVIVRKGEKMAGLVVNSFIGQQEIVLKSMGNYLTQVFAMSGATILGDGQVALIIDTNALIR